MEVNGKISAWGSVLADLIAGAGHIIIASFKSPMQGKKSLILEKAVDFLKNTLHYNSGICIAIPNTV